MNANLLKAHLAKAGETQKSLADAMGVSLSRLNAKLNSTGGAEFNQTEILFIADRYRLCAQEIHDIFFAAAVSI